jgi:hypothetical protein
MEFRNTGTIIRTKKDGTSRYTPISNKILQSKVLTPEQKSILVHLLSLKLDWSIRKTHIHKDMNIGRDRFLKAWNQLVGMGYIVETKKTLNNLKCYHYTVCEDPISDVLKTSETENQLNRNSDSIKSNNEESNEIEHNNKINNINKVNNYSITGTSILGNEGKFEIDQELTLFIKKCELGIELSRATCMGDRIIGLVEKRDVSTIKSQVSDRDYERAVPLIEKYFNLLPQENTE